MRKHQTTVKQIEKQDLIVRWEKPECPPEWLNQEEWNQLPDYLTIREIKFAVRPKGLRTNTITITTTVLDETITAVQAWAPMLAGAQKTEQYQRYFDEFLKMIAYPRCRNRKNRVEPRAKKRRPKNFQLLTADRHLFMPIPHRNKYKKAALT